MKKIERIDFPGMRTLTPTEMNKIHFETGRLSPVPQQPAATAATSTVPTGVSTSKGAKSSLSSLSSLLGK